MVYIDNYQLIELATSIIIKKLYITLESLKNENDLIYDAIDTLKNSYIITLKNEDYTIGKILNIVYLINILKKKNLNYVGFLKKTST